MSGNRVAPTFGAKMKIRLSVGLTILLLPLVVCGAIKPEGKPSPQAVPASSETVSDPAQIKEVEKPAGSPAKPAAELQPAKSTGPVVVFPFKGVVDDAQLMFMRRMLKEAERQDASAFIIDMDTPGGRVDVTNEILDMLHKTKVPTITFVNPNALSAGAFISLGTKRIYMRPDATIGRYPPPRAPFSR